MKIKYIGTQDNWCEVSVTGNQCVWQIAQADFRTDAECALLLATGLFERAELTPVFATKDITGGSAIPASISLGRINPLVSTVSWVGNGTSQDVPCPFAPQGVIVFASGRFPIFAHKYNWATRSPKLADSVANASNAVTGWSKTSFTVGSNADVNAVGESFTAIILNDNNSGKICFGSFSGNGSAGRTIDHVGFKPVFVIAKRDNTYTSQIRFENTSTGVQGDASAPANNITGLVSTGFTVSADPSINQAVTGLGAGGEAYDFIALASSSVWKSIQYVATGADGFTPQAGGLLPVGALVKTLDVASPQVMHCWTNKMPSGQSKNAINGALISTGIKGASTSGISLGTSAEVNTAGKSFAGIVFSENLLPGPASIDKIVPAGFSCNAVSTSGMIATTANTAFDRAGTPWSIEMYVNAAKLIGTDQYLFTRSDNSSNIQYSLMFTTGNQYFEFYGHQAGGNGGVALTSANDGLVHVVLTYDGVSEFKFAVDGRIVKIFSEAFAIDGSATALMTIGGRANSGALAATGGAIGTKFYLTRLYTSVLTAAQILARYKRCALHDFSYDDTDFAEEWDSSNIVGSTLYATKSATNNGTLSNVTII